MGIPQSLRSFGMTELLFKQGGMAGWRCARPAIPRLIIRTCHPEQANDSE